MKTCEVCWREFLDMYDACPFCARSQDDAGRAAVPTAEGPAGPGYAEPAPASPRRSGGLLVKLALGGGVLGVLLYLAVTAFNVFVIVPAAVGRAETARCHSFQVEHERAVMVYEAQNEILLSALEQLPEESRPQGECPEQGAYTLSRRAEMPKVACSLHGWHGDVP